MEQSGFFKIDLSLEDNWFSRLQESVVFEPITNGRMGNNLVAVTEGRVPIVRTTSKYAIPAHNFSALHHDLVAGINKEVQGHYPDRFPELPFNNALIEVYDRTYFKMRYHSDQCLDVAPQSFIALFSSYEHPEQLTPKTTRKLKVRAKGSLEELTIPLTHQSVVLFSTETNTRFTHKIVLDPAPQPNATYPDNRWLGLTFRQSETYLTFSNNAPHFADGTPLTLADESQRREFFQLRGQENRSMDFVYPKLTFTLSDSDLLPPIG